MNDHYLITDSQDKNITMEKFEEFLHLYLNETYPQHRCHAILKFPNNSSMMRGYHVYRKDTIQISDDNLNPKYLDQLTCVGHFKMKYGKEATEMELLGRIDKVFLDTLIEKVKTNFKIVPNGLTYNNFRPAV